MNPMGDGRWANHPPDRNAAALYHQDFLLSGVGANALKLVWQSTAAQAGQQ